jgi:GNAT superfamily N-acetyltransferase
MKSLKPQLIEVAECIDFENIDLRDRYSESSKGKRTRCYRAVLGSDEVALIAIDRWPEFDCLVLYELFVPRSRRGRGVGSIVLGAVERLAKEEGFGAVRVLPRPLDDSIDEASLTRWYKTRGYEAVIDMPGDLEKRVSSPSSQDTG